MAKVTKGKLFVGGLSDAMYQNVLKDMEAATSQIGKPKLAIKILKAGPTIGAARQPSSGKLATARTSQRATSASKAAKD